MAISGNAWLKISKTSSNTEISCCYIICLQGTWVWKKLNQMNTFFMKKPFRFWTNNQFYLMRCAFKLQSFFVSIFNACWDPYLKIRYVQYMYMYVLYTNNTVVKHSFLHESSNIWKPPVCLVGIAYKIVLILNILWKISILAAFVKFMHPTNLCSH